MIPLVMLVGVWLHGEPRLPVVTTAATCEEEGQELEQAGWLKPGWYCEPVK